MSSLDVSSLGPQPQSSKLNGLAARDSYTIIQKGSKSFAWASLFLPRKARHRAWLLYSFCRWVDDLTDEATDNPTDKSAALKSLRILEKEIREGVRDSFFSPPPAGLQAVRFLLDQKLLSKEGPLALIRGMRMDLEDWAPSDLADLEDYCFCVAGVVGLMMCEMMEVADPEARDHAIAMGNAMQMTNICRDVGTDLQIGRVYFPRDWLSGKNLFSIEDFAQASGKSYWQSFASRLLKEADQRYQHGRAGLRFLPFRSALAVGVASRVYQAIGKKVAKMGQNAWNGRIYVTRGEKFKISLFTCLESLVLWPLQRISHLKWGSKYPHQMG